MDINTVIGVLGMSLILFAFLLNQLGQWNIKSIKYDFTNLIGSSLMVYYAFTLESYPFLILNAFWAGFSLKDVIIYFNNKNKK
jgi:hypothetical protein